MNYPNLTQLLINILNYEGINIDIDKVSKSLDDAIGLGQFRFIHDSFKKEIGFYSWEVRHTLTGVDIGVSNLVIYKGCEGRYKLHKIANYFRKIYKNIDHIIWLRRATGQLEAFKQRNHYEYI